MYAFPEPYAPAGRPNKIDLMVSTLSMVYVRSVHLHDADGNGDGPLVPLGPIEWVLWVIRSIPIYQLSSIFLTRAWSS
jgi:hypothetical protein